MQGVVRASTLPMWLRKAGLTAVRRRTTLIERSAPVPAVSRAFMQSFLLWSAHAAAGLDLPQAEREFWASLHDPASLDRLFDDPDVYLCEGNVLAVGRVPEA